MKKIYIYVLIYVFLAMIIGYEINKKFSFKKEKKPIISYEIIDVVSWKKIDGYEITVYKLTYSPS